MLTYGRHTSSYFRHTPYISLYKNSHLNIPGKCSLVKRLIAVIEDELYILIDSNVRERTDATSKYDSYVRYYIHIQRASIQKRGICIYRWKKREKKKNEDSVPRIETQDRLYARNLNHTRWEKLEILSRLQVGRFANTVVSRALTSIVIYLFCAIHEKKFFVCTFHRFPCQIVLSIVIESFLRYDYFRSLRFVRLLCGECNGENYQASVYQTVRFSLEQNWVSKWSVDGKATEQKWYKTRSVRVSLTPKQNEILIQSHLLL